MKKILALFLFPLLLAASPCGAVQLEELWNKYSPTQEGQAADKTDAKADAKAAESPAAKADAKADAKAAESSAGTGTVPGRLFGEQSADRRALFEQPWRYRKVTYELHYQDPAALSRTVYGIALHAGDIDESLKVERFIGGVLGYHYSMEQVCAWLNAVSSGKFAKPALDEMQLVDMLLRDGVLESRDGRYASSGKVHHILGAAPGKKRGFEENLRHERLHVFWDEDAAFRGASKTRWKALTPAELEAVKKTLSRYASGNEEQLMEEWAVHQAESSRMSID